MKKPKLKKGIAVTLSVLLGLAILVFVVMLLFNVTDYGITIASFGATVFMILSRPNLSKKKVFGAYFVATTMGYLFSRLSLIKSADVALAAVSSVAIMTILEFQHAPAIGMSVAMVLNGFPLWVDVVVLLCIFAILGMTLLLKGFMEQPHKFINFIEIEEEKIKWNLKKRDVPDYVKIR